MVACFLTFGLFWGSWAVMLFYIQHAYGLSDGQLGVLLAVAVAVAGASSAVTAHLADRVGARRLLWIALFAWSALLCALALTQTAMGLRGRARAHHDRRRQHRHGDERRGVPPAHRPPVSARPASTRCSMRRAVRGGCRWSGHPCRRVVALDLAGHRRGRPAVGVWAAVTDPACPWRRPRRQKEKGPTRHRCGACAGTGSWCCWRSSPWPR